MKKLLKYSRFLHWMTFLCLCLPFFYTGCKKADAPAEEAVFADTTAIVAPATKAVQIEVDSTNLNLEKVDTTVINNEVTNEPQKSIGIAESKTEEKEETPSEILSKNYTFLKPILVSKENTFSGLAVLIDSGSCIIYFGVFIYALLSILSLIIKYLDSNGIRTIVLLDILSMVFLVISRPYALMGEKLWGLWVLIILVSILAILDVYILTKYHQNKRKDCA